MQTDRLEHNVQQFTAFSTHRPENSSWDCGPRVNVKAIKTGSEVGDDCRQKLGGGRLGVRKGEFGK